MDVKDFFRKRPMYAHRVGLFFRESIRWASVPEVLEAAYTQDFYKNLEMRCVASMTDILDALLRIKEINATSWSLLSYEERRKFFDDDIARRSVENSAPDFDLSLADFVAMKAVLDDYARPKLRVIR